MNTLEKNIITIIKDCKYEWIGFSMIQHQIYHRFGCYGYVDDDLVLKILNRFVNNGILESSKSVICYDCYYIISDLVYKIVCKEK